jgi:hypothetical protein
MSDAVTLYQRPERLTIAKIRTPLSKAAQNLLAKATEMVACAQAPDVDEALDTLRLAGDPDYQACTAEIDGTVVIKKAASEAEEPVRKLRNQMWDDLHEEMDRRVKVGKARSTSEAYDQLSRERHPVYTGLYKVLEDTATPPPTEAITKREQEAALRKRQQLFATIEKRADGLVSAGRAKDRQEALSHIFKNDREAYEAYRKASYSTGPLPDVPQEGRQPAPPGPAYQAARRLALEMKQNDPYGEHAEASETEMIGKVLRGNKALYEQYRQESYDHGW